MITILPLQDEAKKRERLAGIPGLGKDGEILSMQDGREEIGWAAVDLQASVLPGFIRCIFLDRPCLHGTKKETSTPTVLCVGRRPMALISVHMD